MILLEFAAPYLDGGLLIAGALFAPVALYLGFLALLAAKPREPEPHDGGLSFAVVIPAHNEETGIGATIQSAFATDYPRERKDVFVVADNCTDETASVAKQAGAHVLKRTHETERGKGYALNFAFQHLMVDEKYDAFVVIDADTTVAPNLLQSFSRILEGGEQVAQAEYGVRNPDASWRTRLMVVALALFHRTRSLARERLGWSCGLRGNGMVFTRSALEAVPHDAHGLVEDVEHGIALGRVGIRVAYAHDTHVHGEMVSGGEAAKSQRRRWEDGRSKLARQLGPKLLVESLTKRDAILFDLAMDILVPPLTTVMLIAGAGTLLSLWLCGAPLVVWLCLSGALSLYILRGIQHSGLGFSAVTALAYAPVYMAWKVLLGRKKQDAWVRTERES